MGVANQGFSAFRTELNNILSAINSSHSGSSAPGSVTTGTIAVTDDTNTDVSFTQPADTIIRNIIAVPAGNIVTAGGSGNDGKIYTSVDGIVWTQRLELSNRQFQMIICLKEILSFEIQ